MIFFVEGRAGKELLLFLRASIFLKSCSSALYVRSTTSLRGIIYEGSRFFVWRLRLVGGDVRVTSRRPVPFSCYLPTSG